MALASSKNFLRHIGTVHDLVWPHLAAAGMAGLAGSRRPGLRNGNMAIEEEEGSHELSD